MSALKQAYFACATTLLNTLLLLAAIEIPFRLAHNLVDHYRDHTSWKDAFCSRVDEDKAARPNAYQRFEEFRMEPNPGKPITIGTDGFRIVPDQHENPAFSVYVLGDSAVVGTGLADTETIPAVLQKLFNTRTPLKVNVYNRSSGGWLSFQEIVYLLEQLKSNQVPNVVIFYGGFSEIARAAQNGIAGTPWYYWPTTDFFKGDSQLVNLVAGRRHWPRIRFISFIIKKFRKAGLMNGPFIPFVEQPDYDYMARVYGEYPKLTQIQKDQLAKDVFTEFQQNIRFARNLCRLYHITSYFFWQPVCYPSVTHKRLTAEEEAGSMRGPFAPTLTDLTARVMPYIKKDSEEIVNFGDAFADRPETIFMDHLHITPAGNQMMAERIFQKVIDAPAFQSAMSTHGH